MPHRPLWKDYLSAAIKTGGKLVPGVAQAIEVVETVENRREGESRHASTLAELSRVEKNVVDVIEREMTAVLAKLHIPNIAPRELEEEIANLYAMRRYGREPFLAQGLLTNSQWYDQLRSKPNLYGRVLQDHDKPSPECFYMFIDAEKTRMLEVSPFALQQLLGGQPQGAPASKVIGQHDLFAERLATPAIEPILDMTSESPSRVLVRGGTTPDLMPHPELEELLTRAIDGDMDAMFDVSSEPNPANNEQILRWYRASADAGDIDSMAKLGWMHMTGQGASRDQVEAERWYRTAADAGNVESMFLIAELYANDKKEAARWYNEAAEGGHKGAMFNLGSMYESGEGVEKDVSEAAHWYFKAANAGHELAMKVLGEMYAEGRGVERNDTEACRWYVEASNAGYEGLAATLGNIYANGRGVSKDNAESARWYRKAVDEGEMDRIALGEMYENGNGVTKDEAAAFRWYLEAAQVGSAEGMFRISLMYGNGRGVSKDEAEAIRWHRKAGEAGHAEAKKNLGWA